MKKSNVYAAVRFMVAAVLCLGVLLSCAACGGGGADSAENVLSYYALNQGTMSTEGLLELYPPGYYEGIEAMYRMVLRGDDEKTEAAIQRHFEPIGKKLARENEQWESGVFGSFYNTNAQYTPNRRETSELSSMLNENGIVDGRISQAWITSQTFTLHSFGEEQYTVDRQLVICMRMGGGWYILLPTYGELHSAPHKCPQWLNDWVEENCILDEPSFF